MTRALPLLLSLLAAPVGAEPLAVEPEIPGTLEALQKAAAAEEDAGLILDRLVGIVIVDDPEKVVASGLVNIRGVQADGVPLVDSSGFKSELEKKYLGKPLTRDSRQAILNDIALYCRKRGRPFVDVSTLPQDVTGGVLQVLVLQAKIGEVKAVGGRWFSAERLARSLSPEPGRPLDADEVNRDLDWINRNPFRQVDLIYRKGAEFGTANLVLSQVDKFPMRGFAGYDDTGNRLTQNERLGFGGDWGNVLGGAGILGYQYAGSPDFRSLRAHSGSFTQPLPWGHGVTVFGNYADVRAKLPPPFDLSGYNWQTSLRYEVPLTGWGAYRHAATAGFDYKQYNNNITFGGVSVFVTATEVAQWSLTYSARMKDALGETSGRLAAYYSSGGLTPRNDRAHFRASRALSRPDYAYGRAELNRTTRLPYEFSLVNLLTAQMSDANLLPSEQIGFGGHDTVRGYDTRVANSDNGFHVTTEVRTPAWRAASAFPRLEVLQDRVQLLGFADFGIGSSHLRLPGERVQSRLLGAGPGVRYNVSTYLTFRADYGWQFLNEAEFSRPYASRSHIGLVVRY